MGPADLEGGFVFLDVPVLDVGFIARRGELLLILSKSKRIQLAIQQ
jgi:hypothetical protein